ncbi:M56 family metallopeptidase [Capnocytophaga cynodegmi]|uniref:Putative Peptidase M56 BlaR1 n=1 Tax=Capnocytophaga cynodegmi TaxID=28189 RepID=A0A0B7H641_9FLAO|nr:M56 family metallopeptidase [Capnocytophaga cynodegmi]CEN34004.1 putative Peptidase M56 BlaR1 [Capnocytophaga cynodegmi]
MENLFSFIVKNLTFIGLSFILYQIFIKGNTFHQTNRITILLIFIGSLVLPFIEVPIPDFYLSDNQTFSKNTITLIFDNNADEIPKEESNKWFYNGIISVYFIGMSIFLVRYIFGIISLRRIIRSSKKMKLTNCGTIHITSEDISPFSWFSYIILSEKDIKNDFKNVVNHEKAHVQLGHSWDLLFVEFYNLIFWWNPFVWLLKKQLMTIHEFQADEKAMNQINDANQYRKELIDRCVGSKKMALAHNFETSNLKTRIYMSLKEKSTGKAKWGYTTLVLAVGATMILFSNQTLQAQEKETKNETPNIKIIGYQEQVKDPIKAKVQYLHEPKPTVIIDGKEIDFSELQQMNPDEIENITVLKDERAIELYGEKGKNGVIIVSKKTSNKDAYISAIIADLKGEAVKVIAPKQGNVAIEGNSSDVDFYINGKKATISEVKALPSSKISSVSVRKPEKEESNKKIVEIFLK